MILLHEDSSRVHFKKLNRPKFDKNRIKMIKNGIKYNNYGRIIIITETMLRPSQAGQKNLYF